MKKLIYPVEQGPHGLWTEHAVRSKLNVMLDVPSITAVFIWPCTTTKSQIFQYLK